MTRQLRISSSSEELAAIRATLMNDPEISTDSLEIGEIAETDSGSRKPLGFEPLTYFIVVFAAHLSADAVKSLTKQIASKFSTSKTVVTEENGGGDIQPTP